MTQQLTREQLKFARSIGATRYLNGGNCDELGSSCFFFRDNNLVWKDGRWSSVEGIVDDIYYPRIDFSPLDELEPEYVPQVGDECEMYTNAHGWIEAKYVGKDGESPVFRLKEPTDRGFEAVYRACFGCKFRPLPDPEQRRRNELLEDWKRHSLESAHDTEASVLTVGEMIDFIIDMDGE